MADDKNRVEIEVAVRDMFSTTLKSMGKELEIMNKRAMELGVGGAANFDKFRRSNDQLAESNKRTAASFGLVNNFALGLARNLIGPIGLAAGFVAVAKAMSDVAQHTVQLKNFSTDTGFAISKVHDLQQTLRRGGFSKGEGDNIITALGNMGNQMSIFGQNSKIFQDLIKAEGGSGIANRMMAFAKLGDNIGAANVFMKAFNESTIAGKRYLAEIAGVSVSALEQMSRAGKSKVKVWEVNQEEAKKYLEFWVDAEVRFENIFTNVSNHGIKSLNELTQAFGAMGITTKGVAEFLNAEVTQIFSGLKTTVEEIKKIKDWLGTLPENARQATGIGATPLEDPTAGFGNMGISKPTVFDKLKLRSPFKNPNDGGGITDFGGMRRGGDDGIHLLTDIRDTLQRIELGDTGTGGDKGGSGGGGMAISTYGTGARGGALKAGLGGFRAGGVGTRADRNNNPGNIEFGEFAKKQGATGSDGRFAIFPDRETGFKAAEALLGGKGYEGKTLAEIGDRWAEKDKGWAKNVSKATGIPLDAVPTPEQRSDIVRKGIPRAEGSNMGSNMGAAGDGNGLPSAILAQARLAALSGGPEEAKRYIQRSGYNVNSAWCGDFAASVVKSAGGTPPKNPSIASNWRNWGNIVEGEPQPGDIAVRKRNRFGGGYTPTGSTGSHVTIVGGTDGDSFTGLGGNQGARMARQFNKNAFEFRRGEEAREKVDRSAAAGGAFAKGSINAKVDFLNVPNGVKTSAEFDGMMFNDTNINRTKQAERPWEP